VVLVEDIKNRRKFKIVLFQQFLMCREMNGLMWSPTDYHEVSLYVP